MAGLRDTSSLSQEMKLTNEKPTLTADLAKEHYDWFISYFAPEKLHNVNCRITVPFVNFGK